MVLAAFRHHKFQGAGSHAHAVIFYTVHVISRFAIQRDVTTRSDPHPCNPPYASTVRLSNAKGLDFNRKMNGKRCVFYLPTLVVVLVSGFGLISELRAESLQVLWYTYAAAGSEYRQKISQLSRMVHTLPQSNGFTWNLTYWQARDAAPDFTAFDVLVIESGESFRTGPPDGPLAMPDFSGILDNKTAIEAARGDRTFITASDADFHAIRGDAGNISATPNTPNLGGRCVPAITAPDCWDGALGHVVNAIEWAGSGRGLGIVSFLDGEFESSYWWAHPDSFLREELDGYVDYAGAEQNPIINPCQALHPSMLG
jgi:hypothetical protein